MTDSNYTDAKIKYINTYRIWKELEENDVIIILHADCPDDAEFLKEKIIEKTGITNILTNYVGPIIGSHTGAGTIAVGFIGKDKIEPNDELLEK